MTSIFEGASEVSALAADLDGDAALHAVEALARVGSPTAVDALAHALESRDQSVANAAAAALARIGDRRAVEPLIAALDLWDRAGSAAYALGKLGDPRAVEPLVKALNRGELGGAAQQDVRDALVKIGDLRAVELMEKGGRERPEWLVDRLARDHAPNAVLMLARWVSAGQRVHLPSFRTLTEVMRDPAVRAQVPADTLGRLAELDQVPVWGEVDADYADFVTPGPEEVAATDLRELARQELASRHA